MRTLSPATATPGAAFFDNGAEGAQRARRVRGNALALNGSRELWRNFFYLLDRPYSPREILWSFYSQLDPEICTAAFDQEAYFRHLEGKLANLIGDQRLALPRPLDRIALPQFPMSRLGWPDKQHQQHPWLQGAAVCRADADRARQRHPDQLKESRRLRSRADPPCRSAARGISLGIRP
jgi:hypothetical protein